MDDKCPVRRVMERREPTSVTLADLSMLVVGFALVFSMPWFHHMTDRIAIINVPMPEWVAYLFVVREVAMKVGVALVPVILARRARYGGLPRPADWLAIFVGLTWMHEFIRGSEWIKQFARWYLVEFRPSLGFPVPSLLYATPPDSAIAFGDAWYSGYEGFPTDFTPGEEWRLWGWFATILLLITSATLRLGWTIIPGWAKTWLLSLAVLTWLAGVTYLISSGLAWVSEAMSRWINLPSSITYQIACGLESVPEGLLFGVPLIAVLFDLRRGAIKTWAWTGCLGTAIALISLMIITIIDRYADLINLSNPVALTRLAVQPVQLIATGLFSWAVVEHVGGAGRLGNSYVDSHALTRAPQTVSSSKSDVIGRA